ncbi:MAG: head-tail connector protein, partial [bacterium]
TVASNQYYYDDSGNKVVVATLPTDLNTGRTSPVYCEYTVAASHLANYPVVQQASLLMLMHLYNNRSNTSEKIVREIPFGVSSLLRPYKDLVL